MNSEYIAQEKDVIEKAYEVTTNPEILDQFEEYWEAYLGLVDTFSEKMARIKNNRRTNSRSPFTIYYTT